MNRKLAALATGIVGVSMLVAGCGGGAYDRNNNTYDNNAGTMQQQNDTGIIRQQNVTNDRTIRQHNAGPVDRIDDNRLHIQNGNGYHTLQNRVDIAEKAADQVSAVKGVRSAYVLKTRNNAYVAAALDNGNNELTRSLENRIADVVRKVDPTVDNVYVTTNPGFADHVSTYIQDVKQGHPVSGFFDQFGEMVQRIFPNAR